MEFIQQNIYLILLAAGSGGALIFLTFKNPGGGQGLPPTQVTMLINREDAQVIDLRAADDFANGHLPESRNIPLAELGERLGELDKLKEKPLVLVCQNGSRSASACKQLEKQGFVRVNSLAGGINGWRAAGLLVRKGAKK